MDTAITGTIALSNLDFESYSSAIFRANITPYRKYYTPEKLEQNRSLVEMELPAFEQAVTAAHEARVAANGGRIRPDPAYPMLVTDANQLRQFFIDVGAYDHPDGPPAQPPRPGRAARPTRSGYGRTATAWLRGGLGPPRVMEQAMGLEPTTTCLGSKHATTASRPQPQLDLSNNALTGEIPSTLTKLKKLRGLRLDGNSLTGCIPPALRSVRSNDLDSLGLPDCPTGAVSS